MYTNKLYIYLFYSLFENNKNKVIFKVSLVHISMTI